MIARTYALGKALRRPNPRYQNTDCHPNDRANDQHPEDAPPPLHCARVLLVAHEFHYGTHVIGGNIKFPNWPESLGAVREECQRSFVAYPHRQRHRPVTFWNGFGERHVLAGSISVLDSRTAPPLFRRGYFLPDRQPATSPANQMTTAKTMAPPKVQ